MQISGSRVALVTEGLSSSAVRYHRELTVWDWKTGEVVSDFSPWKTSFTTSTQVLELSINHPGIGNVIASTTSIRLLEGSWLLVLSHRRPIAQLLVFNTALPQQDPRSWRILDLPPLSNSGNYSIVTQHEEPQDEFPEFSVDPAQRIFVVYSLPKSALVIPVGLLIQHMYSARTSSCVPWDEWGKDVVTVNLDPDTCLLQLFHTKILTLRIVPFLPQQWGVKVFDLSISGQRDVEAHQVVKGTSKRRQRVLPTPMWFILCPKGDTISRRVTIFGNAVYFFVSALYVQKRFLPYSRLHRTGMVASQRRALATHLEIWPNANPGERSGGLRAREPVEEVCSVHPYLPFISNKPVVRRFDVSHLQTSRL